MVRRSENDQHLRGPVLDICRQQDSTVLSLYMSRRKQCLEYAPTLLSRDINKSVEKLGDWDCQARGMSTVGQWLGITSIWSKYKSWMTKYPRRPPSLSWGNRPLWMFVNISRQMRKHSCWDRIQRDQILEWMKCNLDHYTILPEVLKCMGRIHEWFRGVDNGLELQRWGTPFWSLPINPHGSASHNSVTCVPSWKPLVLGKVCFV